MIKKISCPVTKKTLLIEIKQTLKPKNKAKLIEYLQLSVLIFTKAVVNINKITMMDKEPTILIFKVILKKIKVFEMSTTVTKNNMNNYIILLVAQ